MRRYTITALALCLLLVGTAFAREMNVIDTDTSKWPTVRVIVEVPGRDADASHYILRTDSPASEVHASAIREILDKPLPASMVVALDTSRSLSPAQLEATKKALTSYADQLVQGEQVALLSFNDKVELVSGFTPDREIFKKTMSRLRLGGQTTELNKAMLFGIDMLKNIPGQRTLLVVTDGKDEGSPVTRAQVLKAAMDNNVRISAIGLPSLPAKEREQYLPLLHGLSNDTRGQYRQAGTPEDLLSAAFDLMVEHQDLVTRIYELTFEMPGNALPKSGTSLAAKLDHVLDRLTQTASLNLSVPGSASVPAFIPPIAQDYAAPREAPMDSTDMRSAAGTDSVVPLTGGASATASEPVPGPSATPAVPEASEKSFFARYWPWLLLLLLGLLWLLFRGRKRSSPAQTLAPARREEFEDAPLLIEFPDLGLRFPLKPGTMVLGSAPGSDIPLDDDSVAEAHAEFCVGDACTLRDLPGSYRLLVNGKPVQGATRLKPGDELMIGDNRAVIRAVMQGD